MDIKDVFTKNFTFDPARKDFVDAVELASEYFKTELPKGVNKKKFFTYLCLMYEPHSELRSIASLPQRKVMCALTAGFELLQPDNKFSEAVESVIIGADMNAARMASEMCLLVQGMDMALYTFYSRVFVELVALSHQKDKIKDAVTIISKVKQETDNLEKKIFGGDEIGVMRKMLYTSSKQISLNLRMEDVVDRMSKGDDLSDMNPYPNNYKTEKIVYAGSSEEE